MRPYPIAAITLLMVAVMSASAAVPAMSVQDPPSMDDALAALQSGDFEAAAEAFGAVVEADPENGRAWHLYGYSLHAAGHLEEAIRVHQRTTTFDEFRGIGLYNLGCAYALTGRPEEALEALYGSAAAGFDVAGSAPEDSDLETLYGHPAFTALVSSDGGGGGGGDESWGPSAGDMEQLFGFVAMKMQGIFEEMSPQIEGAVQEVIGLAMMHAERLFGELQQRVEQDEELMGALMMIHEQLAPMLEQMAPMLEQFAPMLEEMGLTPPGAGRAMGAPPASPASGGISIASAEEFAQAGDWANAAEVYDAVVEQEPENITAAFGRAYALHMSGAYEAAIEAHQYASQFDPVRGVALYNLGCALALTGRHEEAVEALRASANAGFDVVETAADDNDLDSLRGEKAYELLMDELTGAHVMKDEPRLFDTVMNLPF